MSAKAEICFQQHNPAVIGMVSGLVVRGAWELGIIPVVALMLRDAGIAIGIMLNNLFSSSWAFWQSVAN